MKVSKGSVVLVGSLVGIPAGDWGLAYGLITEICEKNCCAVVKVDDLTIEIEIDPNTVDAPMSWEGKSIKEMSEPARATFHSVWSNTWIPVEYRINGKWVSPRQQSRLTEYHKLNVDLPRRIKPSEGLKKITEISERREKIAKKMHELDLEDRALVAELLLS